jgi:putative transcriptional regulator
MKPTRKARLRPWRIQTVPIRIIATPVKLLTIRITVLNGLHIDPPPVNLSAPIQGSLDPARILYASGGQGDNHGMAGRKSARRFAGARVFWAPRVLAMCKAMGLSQRVFARLVGVSVKTLQNWEQGRRQPSGPAAVLLIVLVSDPEAVLRALRWKEFEGCR